MMGAPTQQVDEVDLVYGYSFCHDAGRRQHDEKIKVRSVGNIYSFYAAITRTDDPLSLAFNGFDPLEMCP